MSKVSTSYHIMVGAVSDISRRWALRIGMITMLATGIAGCPGPTDPGVPAGQNGMLYFGTAAGGSITQFSFSTATELALFSGTEPSRASSGETAIVEGTSTGNAIKLYNAAGSSATTIYTPDRWDYVYEPVMSPDGSKIAFTYYDTYGDGPGPGSVVVDRSGAMIARFDSLLSPSWTPDGRLVMSGSWDRPKEPSTEIITPKQAGIYLSDAALATARRIDPQLNDPQPIQPSVSPDGTTVAFRMNDHIWTMKIDGTDLRQITTGTKDESYPTWSPDGKSLIFPVFGTFETTFYNAMAIVPAAPAEMINLTNESSYWVRNAAGARLNPSTSRISWLR